MAATKVSLIIDAVGRLRAFADARAALAGLKSQASDINRALGQGIGIDLGGRITQGVAAGGRLIGGFVKDGVKFNATLQETELGLAAIFKSVDRAGNFKTFTDAINASRAAIVALNKEAAKSPFEFGQLLEQFQLASPLLSQFGTGIRDQIDFVTKFSQVARVLLGDQAAFQAPQELRALLTGQVDRTARIAQILFPTEASREALKTAVETGTVIDLLREKFAAYNEGAALGQGNLNQILSNTKDSLNLIGAELTKPLFERVNAGARELKATVESPALREGLAPLLNDMQRLVGVAVDLTIRIRENPRVFADIYQWSKRVFAALAALAALNLAAPIVSMVLQLGILVALFPPLTLLVAGFGAAIYAAQKNVNDLGITWDAWIKMSKLQIQELVVAWRVAWAEIKAEALGNLSDLMQELNGKRLLGRVIPDDLVGGTRVLAIEAQANAASVRAEAEATVGRLEADIDRIVKASQRKVEDAKNAIGRDQILAEETARAAAAAGEQLSNAPLGPVQGLGGGGDLAGKATKAREQAEELRLQTELLRIQQRRALIEADQLAPAQQRRNLVLGILEEERAALAKVLEMWHARRAAITESGPEGELARAQIDREIAGTMGEMGQLDAEALRLNQEAFLETPMGQMHNWLQQMGTMSQQIGQALTQNIGTALDGISNGISNMILGTGTWADAMRQTAASIIQSLVRIGVQMVVQAALGRSLTVASAATTSTAMATTAAAAAPAAAATSVASFGSSAILGSVAALAAIAAIIAAITGGFAEGGLIPGAPSRRDNRLAAVATGEYVVRTDAVGHYGAEFFEALNRMAVPRSWLGGIGLPARPSAASGFAGGGLVGAGTSAEAPKVNIAILNTRAEMRDWMESAEGQRVAFDAVSRRTMELGVRG